MSSETKLSCRFCGNSDMPVFMDLGTMPLANSYLRADQLNQIEASYPLCVRICAACLLVQVNEVVSAETIFRDYAYFSSYSVEWLAHTEKYAREISDRFQLNKQSFVVEVASNDGYLLKNFLQQGIKCLGVEPALNVAEQAIKKGIPTDMRFFNTATAKDLLQQYGAADLMIANNVLAHVPEINDFVAGFAVLLKENGVATFEFPHIYHLIREGQFDTIYHEHFYYYSLYTLEKIFGAHGLEIFDVEELSTHGGSLRIFVCHKDSSIKRSEKHLRSVRAKENVAHLHCLQGYEGFATKVQKIKTDFLVFLEKTKKDEVVAYGAAAKGNTLLNYCGVSDKQIAFVADRSPHKQGLYLPGSHLPIVSPEEIFKIKPKYILILPWNFAEEIKQQMAKVSEWGCKFVTAIPELVVM